MTTEIEYHLEELEIAKRRHSPQHALPSFLSSDRRVLDIGGGIGQTFIAGSPEASTQLICLDIDHQILRYGNDNFEEICYVNSLAETLPFPNETFDFVVSRVALPYTNIPVALEQIYRVLVPGGRIWLIMHSFGMTLRRLLNSAIHLRLKDCVYSSYVVLNGCLFHLSGRQVAFPFKKRYESCQSLPSMKRALRRVGFTNTQVQRGKHFIVTTEKR